MSRASHCPRSSEEQVRMLHLGCKASHAALFKYRVDRRCIRRQPKRVIEIIAMEPASCHAGSMLWSKYISQTGWLLLARSKRGYDHIGSGSAGGRWCVASHWQPRTQLCARVWSESAHHKKHGPQHLGSVHSERSGTLQSLCRPSCFLAAIFCFSQASA